jgi:replicative DNA helicase
MFDEFCISRDVAVERAVLSFILSTGKFPPDVRRELFAEEELALFESLEKQYLDYGSIDYKLVFKEFAALIDAVSQYSPTDTPHAIDVLKQHWIKRRFGKMVMRIDTETAILDIVQNVQRESSMLLMQESNQTYNQREHLKKIMDVIEEGFKEQKEIIGIPSGIREFDFCTSGFEPGKMYVIGALKKSGKSRFMAFLMAQFSNIDIGMLVDSLEMNPFQLNILALSAFSGVDTQLIGRRMKQAEIEALCASYGKLDRATWSIYHDKTVAQLRSRLIYEKQAKKIDVVFVDFLQRMTDDRYRSDRVREVEAVSAGLSDLAREQNVALIALCQLAGRAEQLPDDETPNLSHLKESQGIAENADGIIILHNKERNKKPLTDDGCYIFPEFELKIYQRYGLSGKKISILGDLRCCRFWGVDKADRMETVRSMSTTGF